jgi:glycosyltransferase involved in cell wall biosynthesis
MTRVPRVALTLTQTAHRVPGGTATSVVRLAGALAATGDVELTAVLARGDLRHPGSILGRGSVPELPERVGVATMPLPLPVLYDAWARSGRPHVARAAGPLDLVHVTVPLRVGVGDLPMVATVHDLFPLTRPAESTRRGARLMGAGLEWILRNARAVMVPSATVADACAQRGLAPEKVTVVPWGTEIPAIGSTDAVAVRRRHGLAGPYVLFVGTVEPRKNLEGLISAVARLHRPDLTLALAGPVGWGAHLDAALAGLASPVARLGRVSDADLAALYAGAAVVCYPSFEEGFGLPVLEAMAAGAPVVTSAGTATADVAGDAAVLVDPYDVGSIAEGLASVLDDQDVADRLRSAGRRRAEQHTWAAAAERTVEVYRSVVGR